MAYTTVEGEVARINSRGNGYAIREEQTYNGKTRTTYWSVFPPKDAERTVNEGDRIKVGGFLGTRVSERDARFVDHTLNQAKVLEAVTVAPAAGFDYSDSTPF